MWLSDDPLSTASWWVRENCKFTSSRESAEDERSTRAACRNTTCVHEHQSRGLHWLCQVCNVMQTFICENSSSCMKPHLTAAAASIVAVVNLLQGKLNNSFIKPVCTRFSAGGSCRRIHCYFAVMYMCHAPLYLNFLLSFECNIHSFIFV